MNKILQHFTYISFLTLTVTNCLARNSRYVNNAVVSEKNVSNLNYSDSFHFFPYNFSEGSITVKAYPNPARDYIILELNNQIPLGSIVVVYSFTGSPMTQATIASNKISLNLSSYTRGLYIYQIKSNQGAILVNGKFQVLK